MRQTVNLGQAVFRFPLSDYSLPSLVDLRWVELELLVQRRFVACKGQTCRLVRTVRSAALVYSIVDTNINLNLT